MVQVSGAAVVVGGDGVMRVDTTSDKAGEVVAKNENYALGVGKCPQSKWDAKPERRYGTTLSSEAINEARRLGYEGVSVRIVDRSAKAVGESDGRERILLAGAHAQLLMLAMQGQVVIDDLRSELETRHAAAVAQGREIVNLHLLLQDMGLSRADVERELKRGHGEPSAFKAVRRDAEPGPSVEGRKAIMATDCSCVAEVEFMARRREAEQPASEQPDAKAQAPAQQAAASTKGVAVVETFRHGTETYGVVRVDGQYLASVVGKNRWTVYRDAAALLVPEFASAVAAALNAQSATPST